LKTFHQNIPRISTILFFKFGILMPNNHFILKIWFDTKKCIFEFSTKLLLNLKISACYSSTMLCTNVLLHIIGFDPKSSHVGNMTLTTSIPLGTKNMVFFYIYCINKVKKKKNKKPCGKTMQFSIGLHYQVHKRCWTKLVRGCLSTKSKKITI